MIENTISPVDEVSSGLMNIINKHGRFLVKIVFHNLIRELDRPRTKFEIDSQIAKTHSHESLKQYGLGAISRIKALREINPGLKLKESKDYIYHLYRNTSSPLFVEAIEDSQE